jgi:membrane-associated phospholipid phosphatase
MVGMRVLALALALVAAPAALASGEARCPLPPSSGGAAAIVGAFPAPGSAEAAADLAIVLWEQRTRTPADLARATAEEELSLEDFVVVLGTAFEASRHPRTEALLSRAVAASRPCVAAAKGTHQRPRPYVADARVKPSVSPESTPSFPSGHATRGALIAAVLAELAPDRRDALLARGAQIGHDRVIAGVHYPSDVAAGERLGLAVAQALLADPEFRAEVERVRTVEWTGRRAQGQPDEAAPEPR